MSQHLNTEIVRLQQQEIAARVRHAHHVQDLPTTASGPRRSVRSRVLKAAAAVSACLGIAAAVTTGGASATPKRASGDHASASQVSRVVRGLEAEGYTPWQCTTNGTRMHASGTNRFVDVVW
jgi:hypothetical protein